jgi:hypothetical protein
MMEALCSSETYVLTRETLCNIPEYGILHRVTFAFILQLKSICSDFLAADPEVPGSIPGAARFSEQLWVWNGVHPALVRINEDLLEIKVAAPV